jgi:AmiR/NasT family two-component response regulator
MHASEVNRKLTDRDVVAILTASEAWSNESLAARYGVSAWTVRGVRRRDTKRALRIARQIGLPSPPRPEIIQTLVKR